MSGFMIPKEMAKKMESRKMSIESFFIFITWYQVMLVVVGWLFLRLAAIDNTAGGRRQSTWRVSTARFVIAAS